MSSCPPSRAALDRAINGSTELPSTQSRARPIREARPTEKAQYITDERQERALQRQKPKPKPTRHTRANRAPHEAGRAVITSRDVELNTPKSNPMLDLRPQSGRVPPLSGPPKLKRTSAGFGSREDIFTQSSGFVNGVSDVAPQGKVQANELAQRRGSREGIFTQVPPGSVKGPFGYNIAPQEKSWATELVDRRHVLGQKLFPPDEEDAGSQSEISDHQGDEDAGTGSEQHASNEVNDEFNYTFRDSEGNLEGKRDREYNVGDGDDSENEHLDGSEHHRKHARLSTNSNDAQELPATTRKPQKIRVSKGRVAAKDYEVAVQQILKVAIALFRSRITAEYAYPDRITQVQWAKETWADGCDECDIQINFDNEIIQLITNRTWHLTSELKTKIRPLTEAIYGFENCMKPAVQARNRQLVETLLEDFGLCYKTLGDPDNNVARQGLYENKVIQKAVNVCFYNNNKDEGVLYPKYFQPFPIAGMALILTAIEACIDEWSSGERCDIPFNERIFKPVYENHLSQLHKFNVLTKDHGIMAKLLARLDKNGRRHAKVDTVANEPQTRILPQDAIAAAIQEFEMRDGNFSDDDE